MTQERAAKIANDLGKLVGESEMKFKSTEKYGRFNTDYIFVGIKHSIHVMFNSEKPNDPFYQIINRT